MLLVKQIGVHVGVVELVSWCWCPGVVVVVVVVGGGGGGGCGVGVGVVFAIFSHIRPGPEGASVRVRAEQSRMMGLGTMFRWAS